MKREFSGAKVHAINFVPFSSNPRIQNYVYIRFSPLEIWKFDNIVLHETVILFALRDDGVNLNV